MRCVYARVTWASVSICLVIPTEAEGSIFYDGIALRKQLTLKRAPRQAAFPPFQRDPSASLGMTDCV